MSDKKLWVGGRGGRTLRVPEEMFSRLDAYAVHLSEQLGTKPSRSFAAAHALLSNGCSPVGAPLPEIRRVLDGALRVEGF